MSEPRSPHAAIELRDSDQAEAGRGVLGIWSVTRAPESLSFDVPAGDAEVFPWRVDLQEDPRAAAARLDSSARQVAVTDAALRAAEARLDALATQLEALAQAAQAPVEHFSPQQTTESFGVPAVAVAGLAEPEWELLTLLGQTQNLPAGVSFGLGLGGLVPDQVKQAVQQFEDLLAQLQQFIAYYACVETAIAGRPIGRTIVQWNGHMDTVWRAEVSAEEVALHQRMLDLALASRNQLMQIVALVLRFAVKLSAVAAPPLGPLLALPAVWQFFDQIIQEYAKYQRFKEEVHG